MKNFKASTRRFVPLPSSLLVAAIPFVLLLGPNADAAQDRQGGLQFNVPYSCPGPSRLVVLGCKGTADFDLCDVQYLNAAAPKGLGALTQGYRKTVTEQLAVCSAPDGSAPASASPARQGPERRDAGRAALPQQTNASEGCPSDPGIRDGNAAGSSLEKTFKRAILGNYEAEINLSMTSPSKVGLTFQEFQIGPPSPNRVTRQGVEHSTAAVGEKIYPVRTRHTFCRLYKGGPTRTFYEGRYDCFKDKQSEWVCATAPGHRNLGYQ